MSASEGVQPTVSAPTFRVEPIDTLCVNTIRTLSMDAVQAANSGHPGTPMALAPVGYTLWQYFLQYNPADPTWPNRDRFVLSVGHASMLIYSLLHLAGVKEVGADGKPTSAPAISLDEIKRFRQLNSKTAGHPESHLVKAIETTTGPLGQGVANSVGMAIAGAWCNAHFAKPGFENLFDFHTYALCGDGDLMEGVAAEAASIAGHLKLDNLTWIYDNNRITIEGKTDLAFSEDVATRFLGYNWNVLRVADANDMPMLARAFTTAKATKGRPTLIIVDSKIAWGAPNKQDTHGAHGEPLGDAEIKGTKAFYGWPEDAKFLVPEGVAEHFQAVMGARGQAAQDAWNATYADYASKYPELAAQWSQMAHHTLPAGWDKDIPTFPADAKGIASRDSSGKVLNAIAKNVPWLIGGSADLAPSTKTRLTFDGAGDFQPSNHAGRNFHFGIREHAMASILNGMALSNLRPYGSGFLIFSDYAKAAIRLGALMGLPVIHVFTHDSIGVGEDGPTHQPIEQLISLRAVPGMLTIRPGDANEVAEAWKVILQQTHHPVTLILSRQALPTLDRSVYAPAAGTAKGAYVLADAVPGATPEVILIATGSELGMTVEAFESLKAEGINARVVSMPCWELFNAQDAAYRESVLPSSVTARVAVELGSPLGWHQYVGLHGAIIGMTTFGASAPIKDLLKHFGFSAAKIAEAAKSLIGK
ncbi:transketolase [Tuwongella immobilis]|uniref:Transketolase n=1 Tax=Tuwongella immobilis TaxID=692036 RepID=A0A6C2YIX8_9BACT|nr:transketolase [Tuwongella immobilis]VIP01241.1 transketolase : Transketolase OS=Candidatus Competibacter denitrificans Run_A_D11 GN=tkt PE=4 SV=1: Transketolase_N: Transket_pyr: Transketolase_C [Tuwongella immobilis]VTR97908.1 transketolase : Transketolase OS=Candidatus Competibacter denitrificans Run_A_D11 GN=tkt PE=4 SV=1: Transketolase_N: Transket_pyr: Transketolase_C [Tuwongella immobilis]